MDPSVYAFTPGVPFVPPVNFPPSSNITPPGNFSPPTNFPTSTNFSHPTNFTPPTNFSTPTSFSASSNFTQPPNFTPALNTIPQESKLATYMNLGANSQQHIGRIGTSPTELNPNAEFVPGTFYTSLEEMTITPKEPSPTHLPPMAHQQMSHGQLSHPQLPPQITNQVHQENVGGTVYFYSSNGESAPIQQHQPQHQSVGNMEDLAVAGPSSQFTLPQMYSGTPTHMPSLPNNIKAGLAATFHNPDLVRSEVILRNQIVLQQTDPSIYSQMPISVEEYVELMPIEDCFGSTSSYRGTHNVTGQLFALRRLHDFRLSSTKCPVLIDKWKNLQHPNIAKLLQVFSTKLFGDNSLIFVYEYHPGCMTLMQKYMNTINSNGQYDSSPDPDVPRPYSHQKNINTMRSAPGNLLPESTIWSLLVQLTAALRAIHLQGLACRNLDPSRVIVNGYRVRISWCGVEEVAAAVGGAPEATTEAIDQAQQDDLTALGRMVLALACRSPLSAAVTHAQVALLTRAYSPDLKNLILYLLTVTSMRSVTDLMPMIGARFYTQIEALQYRSDVLEDQLAMELDNARLFRILSKLASINERPELKMDSSWSETGNRYMLKLFRDYIFHPVTADGRPWLDQAHMVNCLNQLDTGTDMMIHLSSRDEESALVVSYAELKHCLETAFDEIVQAATS